MSLTNATFITWERRHIMDTAKNNKATPSKRTGSKNKINLDYDFNTEYGDGDIPDIDQLGNIENDYDEMN